MNLLCALGMHKYVQPIGKCYMECKRCGNKVYGFHDYNGGCKCKRCGNRNPSQDVYHRFVPIDGKCEMRCADCGKTKNIEHTWAGCSCARCGAPKKTDHNYVYQKEYPVYGKCPTFNLTDDYACKFCKEKNCQHIVIGYQHEYKCSKCGNSTFISHDVYCKYMRDKGKILYLGNYYNKE